MELAVDRTIAGLRLELRPDLGAGLAADLPPDWPPDWFRAQPAGPQSDPMSGLLSGPVRQNRKERALFLPLAPVREPLLLHRRPAPRPEQTEQPPKATHWQRAPERLADHALPHQERLAAARLPAVKAGRHPVLLPEQQTARPQARREPLPNRLLQHWIPENGKRESRMQRPPGPVPT